ncbi:hypothetical protein PMAYCL1PPCAC_04613, partial [Pristionchus mayeri]
TDFTHAKGCRILDRPYVDIFNESTEVLHVELTVPGKYAQFEEVFQQSNRILAPRDKYHVVLPCDCIVDEIRKATRGSMPNCSIRDVIESSSINITYS